VDDELDDAIPVELDPLGRWGVGQRLLESRRRGADWATAVAAERARGLLPPGRLGQQVLDEVRPTVVAIHDAVTAAIGGAVEPRAIDVSVDLGAEGVVAGTVPDVHGVALVTATYSRVAAKHRLAAWVRLLALAAARPAGAFRAATVGRARGRGAAAATIGSLDASEATAHLRTLVDLYGRGMREPLPLYCNTSEALARRRNARDEWETRPGGFDREDRDPEHVFVLGRDVPFSALLAEPARPDEGGAGWRTDEPTRIGRYAGRLWDGLLAVEERTGL
jgi:exodeoxyribonuclease V gamma subunit